MADNPATLIIGRSDSHCGVCNRDADPHERAHTRRLGYTPGEGCGAVWTHVTSAYVGDDIEAAIKAMRPDLIFIPSPIFGKAK